MTNWKQLAGGVAMAAISISIVQQAEAQVTTSAVRGIVVNQDGAAVTDATAYVTHLPSGTVSTASVDQSGIFTTRGIRVGGPYSVVVKGAGFADVQVDDVFVQLNETFTLNIVAEVGENAARQDTIVVTASAVNQGTSNLATVFSEAQIGNVATIDRDITDVAALSPFASVNLQSSGVKELSVAGTNNRYNSLTIDGVALNDRFGLNANGYPTQRSPIPFDAIEQLQLEVAPFDTEFNGFTGGTINAVTKSGDNEFHGSVFYEKSDDSMAGDRAGERDFSDQEFEEKSYGFTLGGPIVKDKLFFFAAYEKFEETALVQTLPSDRNIDVADIATVAAAAQSIYGFDVGSNFTKPPGEDEKILVNLDYNITNNQRAKFTYIKTEGNSIVEQNGNNFNTSGNNIIGLTSAWYDRSETIETYVGQLYSDWTDNFSTELKISQTTQATGQDSLNGAEFPSMAVGVTGTNSLPGFIVFGPDRFRHGNELDQEFFQIKAKAEYVSGDHLLKFGFEREEVEANNLFAQNSEGSYLFNSIADFQNQLAARLLYNNAVTNDENDLRAQFSYAVNSMYIQDTWNVSDVLEVSGGLRYDTYQDLDGKIRSNANFANRYGFSNTKSYSDLDGVFLPRLSAKWDAMDNLEIHAGVGRFSGGSPNVWVSNSYSNDGVISDAFNSTSGTIFVSATPDAATGNYIPANVLNGLATKSPDGSVNALDPSFQIPTTWKVNVGAVYEASFAGSEGWVLSADFLYNALENQPYWYDPSCAVVGEAPEGGRYIYDCASKASTHPQSVAVGSVDKGESFIAAFGVRKSFDNGFDISTSYTYQNVDDVGQGTSSTATSNYSDTPILDFGTPHAGTSNFEVTHAFKARGSWTHNFFSDYATTVSMDATYRTGQPYSYTFNENDNCVFDVGGGRCAREGILDDAGHLLYVPTGVSDPLFSAASFGGNAATQQAFFDYINAGELAEYKGGIAKRNGDTSDWTMLANLRLKQELPGAMKSHRTLLTFDIENLGNLLNSDWGVTERTQYEYERSVATAQLVNGQYVYNNLKTAEDIANQEINVNSVWKAKIGIKYQF